MKVLEHLKWSPKWVSHLGCVKGCLDYLGSRITDAWLFGGTGHALIINIGKDSCASGPTAWKTEMLIQQAPALGYWVDGILGSKYQQNLPDIQKKAWDFARASIDHGLPVYAWEVDIPEFYIIFGYDDVGYYYSGPGVDDGNGPKPWKELGDTGIGIIEMYKLSLFPPQSPEAVIRSALEKVLKHASNPPEWIFESYSAGLKEFDDWISSLGSGTANRFGFGYNAAVWHECRRFSIEFLIEARDRLDGKIKGLFGQAIQHYQVVADRLAVLCGMYPFIPESGSQTIPVDNVCLEAVEWLKGAREAESKGLSILIQIVANM